jgi:hypothetical protein
MLTSLCIQPGIADLGLDCLDWRFATSLLATSRNRLVSDRLPLALMLIASRPYYAHPDRRGHGAWWIGRNGARQFHCHRQMHPLGRHAPDQVVRQCERAPGHRHLIRRPQSLASGLQLAACVSAKALLPQPSEPPSGLNS